MHMTKRRISENKKYEDRENANPGLDADHSSEGETVTSQFNDDNDRITGYDDGESDDKDENSKAVGSPLDDK